MRQVGESTLNKKDFCLSMDVLLWYQYHQAAHHCVQTPDIDKGPAEMIPTSEETERKGGSRSANTTGGQMCMCGKPE